MYQQQRQMANLLEVGTNYLTKRSGADRDHRFRIQRNIPKITGSDPKKLLDELEEFEEAFIKTEPSSSKECLAGVL